MKKRTICTLLSILGVTASCWTRVAEPESSEPVSYETVILDLSMPPIPPDLDIYRADLNDGILRIATVSPNSDYQKGGGSVKIFGANIQDGAVVLFGKNQATVLGRDPNGTWIQVIVPPHKTGANFDNPSKETISVSNPSSPPVILADSFRYIIEKPEFITDPRQTIKVQSEAMLPIDATNDGYPDLIMQGSQEIRIQINQKDRTFGAIQTAITTSPYSILPVMAAGDLNKDAINDVVAVCSDSIDKYLCLLKGNGNGTFSMAKQIKTSLGANYSPIVWLAVVDLDLDGNQDIVGVAENGLIYRLRGDGAFNSTDTQFLCSGTSLTDYCFISSDTKLKYNSYTINLAPKTGNSNDIVIGCPFYSNPSSYVQRAVGAILSWDSARSCLIYGSGSPLKAYDGIAGISVSDLNGDNKYETLIADARGKLVIDSKQVTSPSFPNPPGPMAAADINYDGGNDLLMSTNYDLSYPQKALFYSIGNSDKTLRNPVLIDGYSFADGIVAVDFDKDNRMDFIGFVRYRAGSTTGGFPGRTVPTVPRSTTIYFGIGN